jgi:hypothetical protein
MKRFLLREIPRTLLRLVLAFSLFGLISRVPWSPELAHWVSILCFAGLAASVIVICGALLYNTLFYDHYWRSTDSR